MVTFLQLGKLHVETFYSYSFKAHICFSGSILICLKKKKKKKKVVLISMCVFTASR